MNCLIHPLFSSIIRYFRLRPALAWSLLSFWIILASLFAVRWDTGYGFNSYVDVSKFEVVEFALEQISEPQPEIDVSDDAEAVTPDQEILEFGDDSGTYGSMTEGATPPRPVYSSLPPYPRSMRSAGIEGVVVLELGIDENGKVVYGKVAQSLGREFDRTALQWAQSLTFYPALDPDNRPFPIKIHLPIKFALDN